MENTAGIAISSSAIGAICGVIGMWIKAKFGKTKIPQPLETVQHGPFVTVGECKQHRCALRESIKEEHDLLKEVIRTLKENDTRSEERTKATHARIDPLIEEIGAIRGKMELYEKAAINATIGGGK